MKYIIISGKTKETFYQANVVSGLLFYDSVCSIEATWATNELFFVDVNRLSTSKVLSVSKALVFSLTAFWESPNLVPIVVVSSTTDLPRVLSFLKRAQKDSKNEIGNLLVYM